MRKDVEQAVRPGKITAGREPSSSCSSTRAGWKGTLTWKSRARKTVGPVSNRPEPNTAGWKPARRIAPRPRTRRYSRHPRRAGRDPHPCSCSPSRSSRSAPPAVSRPRTPAGRARGVPSGQAQRPHVHAARRLHDRTRGRRRPRRRGRSSPPSTRRAGSTSPTRPGSNEKVEEQLEKKPHRIVRLEDTNGDGKFDKPTVFADEDDVPRRARCGSTARSTSPPRRTSGSSPTPTTTASRTSEEIWFDGKTLTGCANDLHGPYLGPDGWIYWMQGGVREAGVHAAERQEVHHAGVAHLPRPARRHRHRAGDDRRHGQPGRCRLHAGRRTDLHDDVLPAPARTASATA